MACSGIILTETLVKINKQGTSGGPYANANKGIRLRRTKKHLPYWLADKNVHPHRLLSGIP